MSTQIAEMVERAAAARRKVVFELDSDPDFSWLEQKMYDPGSLEYSPTYRTAEDMESGRKPIDGNWYRDPNNHIALSMVVYEECDKCGEWRIADSLAGIDFLIDSDEWTTGTFYRVCALPSGYLSELAREAGLPE